MVDPHGIISIVRLRNRLDNFKPLGENMRFKSQAQARRWEAHQNILTKQRSLNRIEVTTPIEVHDLSDWTVETITSSTDLTKFNHVVLSAVRLALEHGTTITLG